MTKLRHAFVAIIASALPMALAQPLAAQQVQLNESEVRAVALYAMPHAFRSLQTRCSGQLPRDAYIFAQGATLGARLDRAARGQFPAARAAVTRLAAGDNPQMATLLRSLPAENVEPLVRELIAGKVQSEVRPEECDRINQVLELLDPLPPENLAGLMGVFVLEAQSRGASPAPGAAR